MIRTIQSIWRDFTDYGWRYAAGRMRERILIRVAFWLPRSLVYWAFIRFVNTATNCSSPDISCLEAMRRNGDWYSR